MRHGALIQSVAYVNKTYLHMFSPRIISAESTGLLTQAGIGGAAERGAVGVSVIASIAGSRAHALALS